LAKEGALSTEANEGNETGQGRSKVVAAFGRKPLNFRLPSGLAATSEQPGQAGFCLRFLLYLSCESLFHCMEFFEPMSQQQEDRKCPACGGKNLAGGRLGAHANTFIPEGRVMWNGYTVSASVCLDCGFLSHYLDQHDLDEIRRRA
jgi:hypothetical protein